MSKKRKKNRAPRVLCPVCSEHGPNKQAVMIVEKIIVKSSHHPLIYRDGKVEIDFGFVFSQDTRLARFILKCPSCKFAQKYEDPNLLIAEIAPLVEETKEIQKPIIPTKPHKKEVLPKIVKISENVDQYTN